MTFLQQLQAHKGGLIKLKTELYWYEGSKWDNNPGRICLILDAATAAAVAPAPAAGSRTAATRGTAGSRTAGAAAAYLLIDGGPQWVWVAEKDVELL